MIRLGDVTGDNTISALDAVRILQHVAGVASPPLTPEQLRAADVDGDGHATPHDAQLIMQYIAGLIATFPAGAPLSEIPSAPVVVPPQPAPGAPIWSDPAAQAIRRVHLLANDDGWCVSWIVNRVDPGLQDPSAVSELWCALLRADGTTRIVPRKLLDIHRMDREPVYVVGWHPTAKVVGVFVNELANWQDTVSVLAGNRRTEQRVYQLNSATGALSAFAVGRDDLGVHGGIGDVVPMSDTLLNPALHQPGWLIGIETDCYFSPQHQCSWAYRVALGGTPTGKPGLDITLHPMSGAHQTNPVFAANPITGGWIVLVVRDANSGVLAGVVLHGIDAAGRTLREAIQLVPGKFLIETDLQVATGRTILPGVQEFAALWRERLAPSGPDFAKVQTRFVVFTLDHHLGSSPPKLATLAILSDRKLDAASVADAFGGAGRFTARLLRTATGWQAFFPALTLASQPQQVQWQHVFIGDDGIVTQQGSPGDAVDTASVDAALRPAGLAGSLEMQSLAVALSVRTPAGLGLQWQSLGLV